MKKKSSKRYKKLLEISKDKKSVPISDAIAKVKKIVQQSLMSLWMSLFY